MKSGIEIYKRHSQKFGWQTLNYEDENYEIWHNESDDLQYIRLKTAGLKKLAEKYNNPAEGKIKVPPIHVEEMRFDESERFWYGRSLIKGKEFMLHDKISQVVEALEVTQANGLIINATNKEGYLMHTLFFLVVKGQDSLVRVADFESDLPGLEKDGLVNIGSNGRDYQILPIEISNYCNYTNTDLRAQKDPHSCSVMAIDILKNCLVDGDFLTSVIAFQPNPAQKNSIELPKVILGQGGSYIQKLSEEKREKYVVRDHEDHEVNYKTFYKGHDYALKLNPAHEKLMFGKSKEIFDLVSAKREEWSKQSESAVKVGEETSSPVLAGRLLPQNQITITPIIAEFIRKIVIISLINP